MLRPAARWLGEDVGKDAPRAFKDIAQPRLGDMFSCMRWVNV